MNEAMKTAWQEREARIAQLGAELMRMKGRELKLQFALTEQPAQQEPVAYAVKTVGGKKWHSIHAVKESSDKWLEYRVKEQAQGETYEQFALYTTSPQRKPLTDDEIRAASLQAGMQEHYMGFHSGFIRFARAIEAAHNIKENT